MRSFFRVKLNEYEWSIGDGVLADVNVTLSENKRATSCTIKLIDPNHRIAAKLIQQSVENGGLLGLPREVDNGDNSSVNDSNTESVANYTGGDVPKEIVAECVRQGLTDPTKIAFMLAIAEGESSFKHDGYNDEDGRFGQYGGRGLAQITHKYNYEFYGNLLNIDLVGNPDLAFEPKYSTFILVHGVRRGWVTPGKGIDHYITSSNPSDSELATAYKRIQGGVWRSAYTKYFKKWKPKVQAMINAANSGNQSQPVVDDPMQPVNQDDMDTNTESDSDDIPTTPSQPSTPVVDNSEPANSSTSNPDDVTYINESNQKITIQMGANPNQLTSTEFVHTATAVSRDGVTTISGQSIRWILNRQKKTSPTRA